MPPSPAKRRKGAPLKKDPRDLSRRSRKRRWDDASRANSPERDTTHCISETRAEPHTNAVLESENELFCSSLSKYFLKSPSGSAADTLDAASNVLPSDSTCDQISDLLAPALSAESVDQLGDWSDIDEEQNLSEIIFQMFKRMEADMDDPDDAEADANQELLLYEENLRTPPSIIKDILKVRIVRWAIKFRTTNIAVSALLCILRSHPNPSDFQALPKTAQTLFKVAYVPRDIDKSSIGEGEYMHLGLLKQLVRKLSKLKDQNFKCVQLSFSIDGVELTNSSKACIWPILCRIDSPWVKKKVFAVGIHYGKEKPTDLNKYSAKFISELKKLMEEGFKLHENGSVVTVEINHFVCDAPAKCYLLCIIGHTGYAACTSCTQHGDKRKKTPTQKGSGVYYPYRPDLMIERSAEDFKEQAHVDFHHGISPLTKLPVENILELCPRDPMHLVYSGVTKTLMVLWYNGVRPYKLAARQIILLSSRMIATRKLVSKADFPRSPRPITDVHFMKATEFKFIVTYSGIVFTKGILDDNRYFHFLNLSAGIRILSMPKLQREPLMATAEKLLQNFVKDFGELYTETKLTYNFHGLLHLTSDVKKHGSLNKFAAFDFENKSGQIVLQVRTGGHVLEQINNRMAEEEAFEDIEDTENDATIYPCFLNPTPVSILPYGCCEPQFQTVQFPDYKICTKFKGNSCCTIRGGKIILVENICKSKMSGEMVFVGKEFLRKEDFFTEPCKSSDLGIFIVNERRMSKTKTWPVSTITHKNILLEFKTELVVLSLLHTMQE